MPFSGFYSSSNGFYSQTIHLICRKMGVSRPERFCLTTLRRFYLNYDQPLYVYPLPFSRTPFFFWQIAKYGLGTLFEKWELKLLFKSEFVNRLAASLEVNFEPVESTVIFHLPPLQEFGGLNKKVARIDPRAKTKDVCDYFSLWSVHVLIYFHSRL